MELLRSTVHLLHGQADNSLTRVDRLFLDSDPREGVGEFAGSRDLTCDGHEVSIYYHMTDS